MASLSDLRTRLKAVLNRDDCTDDQATQFILDGIGRIQREARLPSMERMAIYTNATSSITSVPIPPDFIQPIDLFVPAGPCGVFDVAPDADVALEAFSYRQLQRFPLDGPVRGYARLQAAFYVRGGVPAGQPLKLVYYGEFSPFENDDDENEISSSSPQLCVYAGLSYAGDVFDNPKMDAWEQRYQQLLAQVVMQGTDVDNNGGPAVVAPTHEA